MSRTSLITFMNLFFSSLHFTRHGQLVSIWIFITRHMRSDESGEKCVSNFISASHVRLSMPADTHQQHASGEWDSSTGSLEVAKNVSELRS